MNIKKNGKTPEFSSKNGSVLKIRPMVLAVGEVRHWHGNSEKLPRDSHIAFIEYKDIGPELIGLMAPDIVLSPLFCSSFDCVDLAKLLVGVGFTGRYSIMTPNLPQPEVILREIRAYYPALEVELFSDNKPILGRVN